VILRSGTRGRGACDEFLDHREMSIFRGLA
jgi:hypothetical protein